MAARPSHLDISKASFDDRSPSRGSNISLGDLPSPRVGEVPPALSPLDALALQGRLLAQRFDDEKQKGRRISRLAPLTVANEFAKRPNYFRSTSGTSNESNGDDEHHQQREDLTPRSAEEDMAKRGYRPYSHYPQILQGGEDDDDDYDDYVDPRNDLTRKFGKLSAIQEPGEPQDYFEIPRAHSPEQIDAPTTRTVPPAARIDIQRPSPTIQTPSSHQSGFSPRQVYPSPQQQSFPPQTYPPQTNPAQQAYPSQQPYSPQPAYPSQQVYAPQPAYPSQQNYAQQNAPSQAFSPQQTIRTVRTDSNASRNGGLAPPRSPVHSLRHQTSNMSSWLDDSDIPSIGGSLDSLPPKKPSTQTSYSRSPSPYSPFQAPSAMNRSPSIASDRSFGAASLPRPTLNFSRPISRSSATLAFDPPRSPLYPSPSRQTSGESSSTRPSFDLPSRQTSSDSPVTPYSADFPPSRFAIAGDEYDPDGPAPSYIYAKYSLPRGKEIKRESLGPAAFMNMQFSVMNPETSSITSSPPSAYGSSGGVPDSPTRQSKSSTSSGAMTIRPNTVQRSTSAEHHSRHDGSPKRYTPGHSPAASLPNLTPSEASTIKVGLERTKPRATGSGELTPEDHLEKGIECHEAGSLQESTYHLRIAAKGGLPTAMLLYALACRHGWGMRPSPAEGVRWLQKAVNSSQLEIADDEDIIKSKPGGIVNPDQQLLQKTHKAQFALSVYELGVSYMNGWGLQKDQALALKCFEVAGNWGDADALTEAGFCYMEGVGTKKDLWKAAKYYREAEKKGVSMAGQSWIYKDKYMQEPDTSRRGRSASSKQSSEKERKPRDKSRTRTIFGRKKSTAS